MLALCFGQLIGCVPMSLVNQAAPLYQQLDFDGDKRHLVFGDIHGRFTTFQRFLDGINYDSSGDVIYSVGDLIDRGTDSVSVVEFFEQENCHAILGNHEHMAMNPAEWEDVWMYPENGGPATVHSLKYHGYDLSWLIERCVNLPVCLDVGDESDPHAFRLLHAESPFCLTEKMLMDHLTELTRDELSESILLWGRSDISVVIDAIVCAKPIDSILVAEDRSPRKVFCGHTPVVEVISAHNVYWIDTFAGDKMTCVNPVTMDIHQVTIHSTDR